MGDRDQRRGQKQDSIPGLDDDTELVPGKRSLTEDLGSADHVSPKLPGKRALTDRVLANPANHGITSPGDAASAAIDGRGAGKAVDAEIAARVAGHTGVDVSAARVHDDPESQRATRAMGARAFAYGNDVFLGPGESGGDRELMGHELTHVAQQQGGARWMQAKAEVGDPGSPAEQHADHVGKQVASGSPSKFLLADKGPLAPDERRALPRDRSSAAIAGRAEARSCRGQGPE